MKLITRTILLAVILFAASFSAHSSIIGGPVYNPATGHNYYLTGAGNWTDSQAFALTLGGNLVTINDVAENTWLNQTFMAPNPTVIPWFGLHDTDANNIWEWISGEPVTYLNWAPGEPNFLGIGHVYGNLFSQDSGKIGQWNNAPNLGTIYAIVEVPEPSVLALGVLALFGCTVRSRQSR